MLFRAGNLVLDADVERMPIVGYDNKVTAVNVTSTTQDADFPIANVANPLTHLKWVGGVNTAGVETITISGLSGTISYLAIVRHNLGTIGASVSITPGDSPDVTYSITDDLPLIFQFPSVSSSSFSIEITSAGVPEIAVIYLGALLTLERSIVPDVPHVPINLGRRTKTVQGRSTSGNYLGSIVLSESRESLAKFMWFDSDWYRANVDPFVVAVQEIPFVFAWNPAEMPEDVGYCWLVEDPMPEFDPVTRRIGVELKMQGVA